MLFFKKKVAAREIGITLFDREKEKALAGYPGWILPEQTQPLSAEIVNSERLYFKAFCADYSIFLALGDGAERNAIIDPYWANMKEWLEKTSVPAVEERMWLCGGPQNIPAESEEKSWKRMTRRLAMYAKARNTPHPRDPKLGENWVVASLLAGLCGVLNISEVLGDAAFFSTYKIETVKMIRSFRITVP